MKWCIPAKTFFLGEYAAIAGLPALLLTTTPCFEVTLTKKSGLDGIHPDSPAGRWWQQQAFEDVGLHWYDPYHGLGGMGASSAQYLGAYYASEYVKKNPVIHEEAFKHFTQLTSLASGARPSGYDVMAQSLQGCVYLDKASGKSQTYAWPFDDIGFILLHTGKKLATHEHLQTITDLGCLDALASIVNSAKCAFDTSDSTRVVKAVTAYHERLLQMNLVAPHSLSLINQLKTHPDVLAIKGCGAMGADVLLLLVPSAQLGACAKDISEFGLNLMATSENLHIVA
jgi:mevalonate kinase